MTGFKPSFVCSYDLSQASITLPENIEAVVIFDHFPYMTTFSNQCGHPIHPFEFEYLISYQSLSSNRVAFNQSGTKLVYKRIILIKGKIY